MLAVVVITLCSGCYDVAEVSFVVVGVAPVRQLTCRGRQQILCSPRSAVLSWPPHWGSVGSSAERPLHLLPS